MKKVLIAFCLTLLLVMGCVKDFSIEPVNKQLNKEEYSKKTSSYITLFNKQIRDSAYLVSEYKDNSLSELKFKSEILKIMQRRNVLEQKMNKLNPPIDCINLNDYQLKAIEYWGQSLGSIYNLNFDESVRYSTSAMQEMKLSSIEAVDCFNE